MEAGLLQGAVHASCLYGTRNVQFKSNIQVPFSAQKLSNCLATVDEAAQKAL